MRVSLPCATSSSLARRRITIKRFTFKLDPLLRLRKREENHALAELAVVMQKVNAQEAIKTDSARMAQEEKALFEKKHREEFTIELFQMYDRYLERLDTESEEAQRILDGMQPELKSAMEKVLEARRRKRAVEIIRERKYKEFQTTQRKLQARELAFLNQRRDALFAQENDNASATQEMEEREGEDEYVKPGADDALAQYYRSMGMEDPRRK
ncbi:MAG: flagellar FliJ family protein [Spirochaetales bacterium]|nr:flagellar FliJ family protein [Spirochaetales bacterium]